MAVLLFIGASSAVAQSAPTFIKAFSPDIIGPGSVSTLTFTIDNGGSAIPATDLAFTDVLPVGVVLSDPVIASTTCTDGLVTAPAGGTSVTFTDGRLAPASSCTVTVNVTSSTQGTHTNTSGDLTSSAGNSGPATDDLTVDTGRPGFSKAFSPATIQVGQTSTLTFTVDNSANASNLLNLSFTDTLPGGMEVAPAAIPVTTCNQIVPHTAPVLSASGSAISMSIGSVGAGATCTVSVDVTTTAAGSLDNLSSSLGSLAGSGGKAAASLTSSFDPLIKRFVDDPAPPGGTVTLEFVLTNFSRTDAATNGSFTDDLDATLSGLTAVGLPISDVCGSGSTLSGTSLLTLSGANLPPEGSCTFQVTLQVPAGAAAGSYANTTSTVTADVGGVGEVFPAASDDLRIAPIPILTKSFTDDPVEPGETVTLEFSITNTSSTSSATNIAFQDDMSAVVPGTVLTPPAPGFCGVGSSMLILSPGSGEPPQVINVSGANLAAGDSCTFNVLVQIPANASAGQYLNTTSAITATVDAQTQVGKPASDTLVVIAGPQLTKSFADDPVEPGGTVTLDFTLTHSEEAPAAATDIAFTDDLDGVLTGLVATGLPANDVCGTGSQISGTSTLAFTGGSLAPGESCTISVTLQVPAGATSGEYTNTVDDVTATVDGESVPGSIATDDLIVVELDFSKSFTDDPVIPGGTVTLEFTLENLSAASDATDIVFTDNLAGMLTGAAAVGLPLANVCGTGSQVSGTTNLVFTGGNLTAGNSCTFSVTVQVPAGAPPGDYGNTTSNLSATIGGVGAVLPPATDTLTVFSPLSMSKTFTDDPVAPGGTVTLAFTVENASASETIDGITFTDDLDAVLAGLVATGLPASDVCGVGSQIAGTSLLTLTGGTLPPSGSCTFSVSLQVPAGVPLGSTFVNTTSQVNGMVGAVAVSGGPATDELAIQSVQFGKAFSGPSAAGATVDLSVTIDNLSAGNTLTGLAFTDDLGAVLPGLVATGLPQADVCGAGSSLSGSGVLTLAGGELAPGDSCTIVVSLQVPAGATAGSYPNTTSELFANGLSVAPPATATLAIEPPPAFAKVFAPDTVGVGGVSTLTFTIDNAASALAATGLDFTDNLPAGVQVATPPNAATTCTGGTLTAVAGSGTITYSGGAVAAGADCTVTVDVTPTAPGSFVNLTGDLTSSSGNSGTATDTLDVQPPPLFTKAFAPDLIAVGGLSTLTFTIDNSASTIAATGLDFTDNLPAGAVVATPPNASTTCTGGTVTAVAASAVIGYTGGTVAAGASCTVSVEVTASAEGSLVNVSDELTSSSGNSGTATDTLEVRAAALVLTKSFSPSQARPGDAVSVSFTIENGSSLDAATVIAFSDDLSDMLAGLSPQETLPIANVCGAGSALIPVGGPPVTQVALSNGSLPAGGSCTFAITIVIPEGTPQGDLTNTTSTVTGQVAGFPATGAAATAILTVVGVVDIPLLGWGGLALLACMLAAGAAVRRRA